MGVNNEAINLLPTNCLHLIFSKNDSQKDCFSASLVCKNWVFPARAACRRLDLKEHGNGFAWMNFIKILPDFIDLEVLVIELRGPSSKLPTNVLEAIGKHCISIMSLTVKGHGQIEEIGLFKLLQACSNLRYLDIADAFLEKPLALSPWPRHNLETISMGNCLSSLWNGERSTTAAHSIISGAANLQKLTLKDWWGCDDETCEAICSCKSLVAVDLTYTSITELGVRMLKSSNFEVSFMP